MGIPWAVSTWSLEAYLADTNFDGSTASRNPLPTSRKEPTSAQVAPRVVAVGFIHGHGIHQVLHIVYFMTRLFGVTLAKALFDLLSTYTKVVVDARMTSVQLVLNGMLPTYAQVNRDTVPRYEC